MAKLVRDNIPSIIEDSGRMCRIHICDDKEYKERLDKKLLEEVNEYLESHSEEELADVLEVIDAIIVANHYTKEQINNIKRKKKEDRGAFDKRICLDEVLK